MDAFGIEVFEVDRRGTKEMQTRSFNLWIYVCLRMSELMHASTACVEACMPHMPAVGTGVWMMCMYGWVQFREDYYSRLDLDFHECRSYD